MWRRLWMSGALVAVTLAAAQMVAAQTVPACYTTELGERKILTEDLDCRAYTTRGTAGVVMDRNTTLDCNGYAIIGPGLPRDKDKPENYGISAESQRNVIVKNCKVYGYDRGLYFLNVRASKVNNSEFYNNTRYGADIVNEGSFGNIWDGNTFHNNGDEGIHISGLFRKPNKFKNSSAYSNVEEGWYLLNTQGVEIFGGSAHDNGIMGEPGIYIKHSPRNKIYNMRVTRDTIDIIGESDFNNIHDVTVVGGQVKIEKYVEQGTGTTTYPDHNILDQVCVQHENGVPSTGFIFDSAVNGYNSITKSETILMAGNPVKASGGSTLNSVVSLYISPPGLINDISSDSSFTPPITMQSTTPPACY